MNTKTLMGAPRPVGPGKVGRGVALYSYQEEVLVGQMTLEDCLAEAACIGAEGIELIAETFVPSFPNPPSAWLDRWHEGMARNGLVGACYTQFIDTMRTKSRNLTVEEGVVSMMRDVRLAKQLGIPRIRCLMGTPITIIEATIPHLERAGIWMGLELHAPVGLQSRFVERLLRIAENTDVFGFVPDMGIFQNSPNPFARDRAIRDGRLDGALALQIEAAWKEGRALPDMLKELQSLGAAPSALGYAQQVFHVRPQDPEDLRDLIPYCKHIHGKTWGMTEDCLDPAIDLAPVIPMLVEAGFDGYIATEYEGQRHVQDILPYTEVEQVRRYHVRLKQLLGY
ncbi:MAG: hypothetical protein RLZZ200_2215 [Pseudomonadota bacterium]|jgi:sugar phosphate isomerase/epimerase